MFTSQHSFRTHSSYPLSSGSANSAAAASHEEDDAAGPRNGANLPDGIPRVEEEGNEEEEDGEDDDRAEEEGEDEEEDEDEEEGEAEPNWMHQFTAARAEQAGPIAVSAQNLQGTMPVKVEPVADLGRESGLARQGSGSMPRPLVGAVAPVKEEFNKTSTLDVFQTSGYCAREENLKKEEDAGRIKFVCYSNDGVDQHMIWYAFMLAICKEFSHNLVFSRLIGLKNIFSRQLPNMPKEYIVRLVMDRSHKSMMIIKQNQVIGGITYRPYPSQKFGEIAFCAITAEEQVKGYGTRLMNHLKQYARDVDGLTHFLTYADNNAVGYFSKQGFTKEIELEKERWQGYIKDYDRVTLMECKIDSKLPYINLPEMVRRQRQAIEEKVREYSNYHIIYPGIEVQKKDAGIPQRILSVEDIPGLKEAGWSPEQSTCSRLVNATSEGPPTRQSLHAFMRSLLKVAVEHVDAWPFKQPVDASEVPDYYEVIKDPIDLKTISRRLDSEQFYLTLEMFEADMRRMFANARIYNRPDTIYYKCANRLENFFMSKLQTGIQASSRPQHGTIKTSSPSNVAPKEYSASFDGTAEAVAPTMSDPGSPTPLDREKVNCKAFDKKGRVNCSLFYKCPCTYCEQWRLAKQ